MFGDDKAIICGLANIENESVMLIGTRKEETQRIKYSVILVCKNLKGIEKH